MRNEGSGKPKGCTEDCRTGSEPAASAGTLSMVKLISGKNAEGLELKTGALGNTVYHTLPLLNRQGGLFSCLFNILVWVGVNCLLAFRTTSSAAVH